MAIDRVVLPKGMSLISMLFYGIALAWSCAAMAEEQEQSQEPFSLGVVDRQQIIRESLAGENVRNEFEAQEKAYRDEISARENELRAHQETLAGQRAILTPEAFAARESEFANKVEQLQRDVNERNKNLENMLAYGMQQIDIAAIQIIAEIANERKFTLVLDKTQLLMVAKNYEFSDLVITILNERLPVVTVVSPEELPQ